MSEISKATPTMTTAESNPSNQQPTGAVDLPGMHHSYWLDGRNYLRWAQLVRTFLKGRGKIGHLTGPTPKDSDPTFIAWDTEDSLIMSWLWSAMQPEVSNNLIFSTSVRNIWETVRQIYSKVQNASVIF